MNTTTNELNPPPLPRALKVSTQFSDLLAFSGPAPERINGRLAMTGFVSALAVELTNGQDLFTQVSNGGLVPLFKGVRAESKSNGLMTSDAELWNETVYMHQPPGFTDSAHFDYVCLLQKSLYGLKQSTRAWFQRFSSYAIRAGFYHSKTDSSFFLFHKGSDTAYSLLYVDDIILTASSTSLLQRIISSLHAEFAMTDLGPLNYFLGISATCTTSGIFLSQKKYATEILEQAQILNCNPCKTSIDTEKKLRLEGSPVTDPTLYRSLAGSLYYLTFTRPDLSYAVQQLCLYMHDPREPHLNAMKRVLRYLQGTTDLRLQLFRSTTSQLIAYSDADWAGCLATRLDEAEYRGVTNAVAKTSWIRNLLRELHTPLSTATLVYYDNVSAVYMSANLVQHQRTKYIQIDIHFVRDKVAAGHVRVLHVPSRFQYADIFIKGLPYPLFADFRSSLSVRKSPAPTAEAPNGKLIHNSILNGPYVRRMIVEPGDGERDVNVNETFHEQTDDELSERELKQIEADDQAIQTILLGLPEDIYAAVDSCETAQEIWLRVQQMMKGSDIGIQEKKAKNKHFPEKIASNLKFLNNLQPEWSRHVTIIHQTKDLHTADYTQLYDFLKYNQKENVENQVALNPRVQNVGNQNGLIGVQGNGIQNQIGNG
nr:ribonuclease H-like domain-containing protein [Tanacetum cinerariifolium]